LNLKKSSKDSTVTQVNDGAAPKTDATGQKEPLEVVHKFSGHGSRRPGRVVGHSDKLRITDFFFTGDKESCHCLTRSEELHNAFFTPVIHHFSVLTVSPRNKVNATDTHFTTEQGQGVGI